MKYYVYAHFDCDGNVFYIGRGRNNRAWQKSHRSRDWYNKARFGYTVEIIKDDLSFKNADNLEEGLILSLKDKIVNKNLPSKNIELCYKELSEYFEYNEHSPSCLVRIKKMSNGIGLRGTIGFVGYKTSPKSKIGKQYWKVKHKNKGLLIHRIIWVICNKKDLPVNAVIDHINGNGLDNRIVNLRVCSIAENNRNKGLSSNSTTGVNGVTWANDGRYRVKIVVDGKKIMKTFRPNKLYPSLPAEEAKQRAFEDAVDFRKQMEAMYYK